MNSVGQRSLQFTCLNLSKADKFTSEYMSSLSHVDFSVSGDDSRSGHSSCVERTGGG